MMKYIVLVGDGMADRPLKRLGYMTCLQKANTPNMDMLAMEGEAGMVRTIPVDFEPGSDIANLTILGYNPRRYYRGRAPLEAAFRGVNLGPRDVAFRCNLVTLGFRDGNNNAVMEDYSAGHITTREAEGLINEINRKLGSKKIAFYPGVSYRHLMVWKNGSDKIRCTPPHDITGKRIGRYLPSGRGAECLLKLMEASVDILLSHPVNRRRIKRGLPPANSLWFWGQGRGLRLPRFKDRYGLNGVIISAVDLMKGIGISAGFDVVEVKGATGYLDTNYEGKARAALKALERVDLVYLHVEAPDEAGHNGDIQAKIKAIEDFDSRVVARIIKGIRRFRDYSILLLPDHATPISVRTHTNEPVPFVIYRSSGIRNKGYRVNSFSERIKRVNNALFFEEGNKLMDYFIKGS
jgi:2,3-bisphosphoglycerate-independent phosphoglycerate mutase